MNDLAAQACVEFEARGASIAEAMCATSNEEVGQDRASPSGPGDFGLRLRLSSLTYHRGYARSSFLVSLQTCLAKSFILFLDNALVYINTGPGSGQINSISRHFFCVEHLEDVNNVAFLKNDENLFA